MRPAVTSIRAPPPTSPVGVPAATRGGAFHPFPPAPRRMLPPSLIARLAQELAIAPRQVTNTLALFAEGNTLPFIARYRKEATEGLDEVQLRDVRDRAAYLEEMEERRAAILKSVEEQGKL